MSWKGFQKAFNRLPHQILSSKGETTQDEDFNLWKKKLDSTFEHVQKLAKDVEAFCIAVVGLVANQHDMAEDLFILYDPHIGVKTGEEEVQRRVEQTPASAIMATKDARDALSYCRDEVKDELIKLDVKVKGPILEVIQTIKGIEKTVAKRKNKLTDYDRHRISLNKLRNKDNRSTEEEKKIFKVEGEFEVAKQDYEYLNNMLKRELPTCVKLTTQLAEVAFVHFYNAQCAIFGIIYSRCYELAEQHKGHFTTHQSSISVGYKYRKDTDGTDSEIERLGIVDKKVYLKASGSVSNAKLSLQERAQLKNADQYGTSLAHSSVSSSAPPPYSVAPSISRPPPPPLANKPAKFVVALYDYDAQQEGDLSFRKDDRIELLEKTADQNDWWTGRLGGKDGVFPGNYVEEQ